MFEKPLQTDQNTGPGSDQLPTTLSDIVELPKDLKKTPPEWGSDVIADVIRSLDLRYIALNPGASFRGLHDSFVNYLGNRNPQMLLCLHEEHAVCIAHGYAKVTGRPMGAFLHSNVGLMHGSAGIFNAWCDRVPMMVFGATGKQFQSTFSRCAFWGLQAVWYWTGGMFRGALGIYTNKERQRHTLTCGIKQLANHIENSMEPYEYEFT